MHPYIQSIFQFQKLSTFERYSLKHECATATSVAAEKATATSVAVAFSGLALSPFQVPPFLNQALAVPFPSLFCIPNLWKLSQFCLSHSGVCLEMLLFLYFLFMPENLFSFYGEQAQPCWSKNENLLPRHRKIAEGSSSVPKHSCRGSFDFCSLPVWPAQTTPKIPENGLLLKWFAIVRDNLWTRLH